MGGLYRAHSQLINAIGEYGKAMLEFGDKGGYKVVVQKTVDPHGMILCDNLITPVDEEAREKAAYRWGNVLFLLNKHFSKPWWKRWWWAVFGD